MTHKLSRDDVAEINDLILLYCLHADARNFDEIAALLADAELYIRGSLAAARSAETVRKMFSRFPPPTSGARRHVVSNILVRADETGGASAISYYTWIESLVGTRPTILGCGVYRDRFGRFGDAWRFIERRIESDGGA